ncbi:unnamed protein product [Mesocestoides corti]|uniref:adenylate cyclase n=1 Tax=Mesocestoides corti TaxID=53468 RepID=A0A0R3UEC0_MESCO|nr:unnamed protein product [Mesocestoides corti]
MGGNLLGHELTDIVNATGDPQSGSLADRLVQGIGDAVYCLHLRSRLLKESFDRLNLPYVKASFRRALIYLSLLLCVMLMDVISKVPFGGNRIFELPVYIIFIGVGLLTLLTFYDLSANSCTLMSIAFTTVVGICILVNFGCLSLTLPLQYTLVNILIFAAYMHLPIPLSFSVACHLLLYVGLTTLDSYSGSVRQDHPKSPSQPKVLDKETREYMVATTCFYLVVATSSLAAYVKVFNSLRFRASFLRICQALLIKAKGREALSQQATWLDAVMPKRIRIEYRKVAERHRGMDHSLWVFCDTYDPVSILFAKISGLTALVNDLSAKELLVLLNSLFSSFDVFCYNCGCERIGVLGTIYYCVSGCPKERSDHAVCCSNLALAMMKEVNNLGARRRVDLELAVAIHTGNINGAVVGIERIHFDIYSHSVLTAQKLLAACEPGRIRISEEVLHLLPPIFSTSPARPITELREVQSAIAGKKLEEVQISTYYLSVKTRPLVDQHHLQRRPRTRSIFRLNFRPFGNRPIQPENQAPKTKASTRLRSKFSQFCVLNLSGLQKDPPPRHERLRNSAAWNKDVHRTPKPASIRQILFGLPAEYKDVMAQLVDIEETNAVDNTIIKELSGSSKSLTSLFQAYPINPITLRFYDASLEQNYRDLGPGTMKPVYIDSVILTSAFDVVFLFFYIVIFTGAYATAIGWELTNGILSISSLATAILTILPLVLVVNFAVFGSKEKFSGQLWTRLLRLSRSRVFIELICFLACQLPTLETVFYLLFIQSGEPFNKKDGYIILFAPIAIFVHCLPMDSCYLVRCLSSALSTGILSFALLHYTGYEELQRYQNAWFYDTARLQPSTVGSLIALLSAWILVVLVCRLNETTCRLSFYTEGEAESADQTNSKTMLECDTLLYNIIPRHVVNALLAAGQQTLEVNSVSHANYVPNAGIAFVRLTNFFKGYYREDYQGGKQAIGLLNQIICMFDRHLQDPEFKEVEKLKTYNDSYMIGAGLDALARDSHFSPVEHLLQMVKFCLDLFNLVDNFNSNYILGEESAFDLAIGMDVGAVCAGVIVSMCPRYHVIGSPTELAYLLHLTAPSRKLVVSEATRLELAAHCQFDEVVLKNPPNFGGPFYRCFLTQNYNN